MRDPLQLDEQGRMPPWACVLTALLLSIFCWAAILAGATALVRFLWPAT